MPNCLSIHFCQTLLPSAFPLYGSTIIIFKILIIITTFQPHGFHGLIRMGNTGVIYASLSHGHQQANGSM